MSIVVDRVLIDRPFDFVLLEREVMASFALDASCDCVLVFIRAKSQLLAVGSWKRTDLYQLRIVLDHP